MPIDEQYSSCEPSAVVRSTVLSHSCINSLEGCAKLVKVLDGYSTVVGTEVWDCGTIDEEVEVVDDDGLRTEFRAC